MKELKELKDASDAAGKAAHASFIAAIDAGAIYANRNYYGAVATDARKDFNVARDNYRAAQKTYDAAMAINSYHIANREKKMKTENKMTELRAAAVASRDARMVAFTTYSAACLATDAAWDTYNAACEEARDAANTANAYEVGEYETNPYEAEDK